MRSLLLALGLIAFAFAGCANLLIQEDDSAAAKVAKVGARALLGVTTFGISELALADQRDKLAEEQQLEAYRLELARLVDTGQLTKELAERFSQTAQAEAARRIARRSEQRHWALGAINAGSPLGSQRSGMTSFQTVYMPPSSSLEPLGNSPEGAQTTRRHGSVNP